MTTRRVTKSWVTGLTMLTLPLVGGSCFQQKPLCPALESCGNGQLPVGDWVLASSAPTSASCSELLYTPPSDPRLQGADLPAARTVPPDPALYDWCDLLVTAPNVPTATSPMIMTNNSIVGRLPNFDYTTFPIGAATIHYGADGKYALSTTRTGRFALDFSSYCMRAFGAVDTARDPNALPASTGSVCEKLTDALSALAPSTFTHINCVVGPTDPGGCVCGFDVKETKVSSGTVGIDPAAPSDMTHLPGTQFPEDVTYCAQGDTLQLTGANGQYLFDRVGLRTLDLVKVMGAVNCTDGAMGVGEDGVDCGPACQNADGTTKFCP
jgi:hypothetical protein